MSPVVVLDVLGEHGFLNEVWRENMFESLLQQAQGEEMTPELALRVLQGARDPANAIDLFRLASEIRDQNLGRHLYWTAGISQVIPCRIVPRCRYCTYYARSPFSLDSLARTAKKIEELGLRQLHLSGGSNLAGYDQEILDMVAAIRAVSDIEIEVNLGASFSADTVRELKKLGVLAISSPLETTNEELFCAAKPGDSLLAKKQLIELCEAEGIPVRTFLLIGLGETDADRVADLFYLKDFRQLSLVAFSRFEPYPDTKYANHPRCSPWEVAITLAVARLLMPTVHLGLAAGNRSDDLPLALLAGAGNKVGAAMLSRTPGQRPEPGTEVIEVDEGVYLVNRMPLITPYLHGMGFTV